MVKFCGAYSESIGKYFVFATNLLSVSQVSFYTCKKKMDLGDTSKVFFSQGRQALKCAYSESTYK